jgi:hypothetical protein
MPDLPGLHEQLSNLGIPLRQQLTQPRVRCA